MSRTIVLAHLFFKINLVYHIFQPCQVILTIVNPLDFLCHVTLLPRDPDADLWSNAKVNSLYNFCNYKLLKRYF